MRESVFTKLAELEARGEAFVLITLVSARGSSPADPGSKAVVTRDGLQIGTVGGGKVEARAIRHSQELLNRDDAPATELLTWNLQRDIGMTCGGEITYLFELYRRSQWTIALFGAGHVGQAVTRVLEPLHCQLSCTDHRVEWVERLPVTNRLRRIHHEAPAETVASYPSNTFFVVMTQGHATDVPVLEAIARHHPQTPYVGVIGSDVKGLKIRSELKARGVAAEFIEKLRCPIGLPFGTNATEEIALSIAGELLQERDRMRERSRAT